tara:strand:- start:13196 stop:13453 length:258 start_codon:yes stop_codon:yes gene_type:complete
MGKEFKGIGQVNELIYTIGSRSKFCKKCQGILTLASVMLPLTNKDKYGNSTYKETFLDCLDCNEKYFNMCEYFLNKFVEKHTKTL